MNHYIIDILGSINSRKRYIVRHILFSLRIGGGGVLFKGGRLLSYIYINNNILSSPSPTIKPTLLTVNFNHES